MNSSIANHRAMYSFVSYSAFLFFAFYLSSHPIIEFRPVPMTFLLYVHDVR
jgi:hypothetical protein